MDDIAHRRRLEINIDQLRASPLPEVQDFGERAWAALREKKLDKAQALVNEGMGKSQPVNLLEILVAKGGYTTKAHARRAVESGKVLIDGKAPKSADADVKFAKSIRAEGKELLGA